MGAAVETVALMNRTILSQAPAMAIQMLEYKAREAGIQFTKIETKAHKTAIAKEISTATKTARAARRTIKEHAA